MDVPRGNLHVHQQSYSQKQFAIVITMCHGAAKGPALRLLHILSCLTVVPKDPKQNQT